MQFLIFAFFAFAELLAAQTVTLRGDVADPSGAVIPKAIVVLSGSNGFTRTAAAADNGAYVFANLWPGNYVIDASAPELKLVQPQKISLRAGNQLLNLQLQVASTSQQLTVRDNAGEAVSTDPASNAGALVLRGDDLKALSDDPDDLAADLQALAGPSAERRCAFHEAGPDTCCLPSGHISQSKSDKHVPQGHTDGISARRPPGPRQL